MEQEPGKNRTAGCKNGIFIFVLAFFCLSLTAVSHHKVRYVYDGDTILLEEGEHVRLLGIDAPEVDHKGPKSDFMGVDAWKFNQALLRNAKVSLEYEQEKKDRYGRLLAYVFLENHRMVNDILVRNGMAHLMRHHKDMKYDALLLESQRKAMDERLGIWSAKIERGDKAYAGNSRSFRFHHINCPLGKKISGKNRVLFETRRDAFWQGYSPCRQCRP